jgi:hypothetical protein
MNNKRKMKKKRNFSFQVAKTFKEDCSLHASINTPAEHLPLST